MLASKLNEILTTYHTAQAEIIRTNVGRDSNTLAVIEVEAKFGSFDGNFKAEVPYVHYERILRYLRTRGGKSFQSGSVIGLESINSSEVASDNNEIRRITEIVAGYEPERIRWQRKQTIGKHVNITEYDIRVSINIETPLLEYEIPKSFNPTYIRSRHRSSFVLANGVIRIDLTEVSVREGVDFKPPNYEIEVEFLGDPTQFNIFETHLLNVFRIARGSHLVYSNSVKYAMIYDMVAILGSKDPNMIDSHVLVEARNIKKRDLVYGGIVGNRETRYAITFKADGLRKMLIIHSTGIWLVYPPHEFNLLHTPKSKDPELNAFILTFDGTVFDGELVEPKIFKPGTYTYLAFDCLALNDKQPKAKQNASIQKRSFLERHAFAKKVQVLRSEILTVNTKDTEVINSPSEYFRLVNSYLARRAQLPYREDGLIFIPVDVVYNPHTEKYQLFERSLTRYPDTCKWKQALDITIDFAIRPTLDGHIELYSYQKATVQNGVKTPGHMVKFEGDQINPVTVDMIDHSNPMTLNKRVDSIFEYEFSNGKFRPRKPRLDKQYANRLDVAIDDWEDIMNPISCRS